MTIKIFTLFPEMFASVFSQSILKRAIDEGRFCVRVIDIRAYSKDKHGCADDYPFGGGAGMVMLAQPIVDAVLANMPDGARRARRVYLSPRGRTLTQRVVEEYAKEDELMLLCGHYEGVDQRAIDLVMDEELSIGDYVLTGGELGAMVLVDAVARMLPGVLGNEQSRHDESFSSGLLEYPQYTRPREFMGMSVPEVLLSGHHLNIGKWRREKSLEVTIAKRPELLKDAELSEEEKAFLSSFQEN